MSRKIDFGGDDWSAVSHQPYLEDALNPKWPGPIRVSWVAIGRHAANGHAYFKQGELAKLLPLGVGEDGLPILPTRQTLNRWVKVAIEYGFLDEGSKLLCLIVPRHRVQGGRGDPNAPCRRHPRKTKRHSPERDVWRETSHPSVNVSPRTSPPRASRLTLAPSLSSLTAASAAAPTTEPQPDKETA